MTGVAVFAWLLLCVSLTLVLGSGAQRYPANSDIDSMPLFIAGVVCFLAAALIAMVIRGTGAPRADQQLSKSSLGLGFVVITMLVALAAGFALDAAN
jgi:hypothetical protein